MGEPYLDPESKSKKPCIYQTIGNFNTDNTDDIKNISVNIFRSDDGTVFYFTFFLKRFYLFIFRESGRKGERKGEKHQLVALTRPQPGTRLVTQACALTGNGPSDPSLCGTMPNQVSHTGQAGIFFFNLRRK